MDLEVWERELLDHPDLQVAQAVVCATRALLSEDAALLLVDSSERSIAHRLACHLASALPGWDVDCEYNRDGHGPKVIQALPSQPQGRDESRVYPDIIVHRRGTDENYLVIELKKTTNRESGEYDHAKLRAYKRELKYAHALFMNLVAGDARPGVAEVIWE